VSLYERDGYLGGAFVMASTVHADNEAFLDFLTSEVSRAGVDVHLATELDADGVARLGADAVIVATGGRVVAPEIPGSDLPHVLSGTLMRELLAGRVPDAAAAKVPAWQRLGLLAAGPSLQRFVHPRRLRALTRGWMPLGQRVVVIGGDLAAVELAEFLAERGRRVDVVEPGREIAPEVGLKRRTEHMDRLDRLGVVVHTELGVERIARGAVVLANGRRLEADSVVLAGEVAPDTTLYDTLAGRVPELHAIGDCTGLGLVRKATEEGARVACAL
jgi:2,4-dienoyl-CoA reductase (NADPH2)